MLVDIENFEDKTIISFKLKDLTSLDEIVSIGSAMANRFCFEAGSLMSEEFKKFISNLTSRKTYVIVVGVDYHDKPYVDWGVLKSSPNAM